MFCSANNSESQNNLHITIPTTQDMSHIMMVYATCIRGRTCPSSTRTAPRQTKRVPRITHHRLGTLVPYPLHASTSIFRHPYLALRVAPSSVPLTRLTLTPPLTLTGQPGFAGFPLPPRGLEATRVYNRRWEAFLKRYLTGDSELGSIEHVWYRQEDRAQGSLHVHAAIWATRGM